VLYNNRSISEKKPSVARYNKRSHRYAWWKASAAEERKWSVKGGVTNQSVHADVYSALRRLVSLTSATAVGAAVWCWRWAAVLRLLDLSTHTQYWTVNTPTHLIHTPNSCQTVAAITSPINYLTKCRLQQFQQPIIIISSTMSASKTTVWEPAVINKVFYCCASNIQFSTVLK